MPVIPSYSPDLAPFVDRIDSSKHYLSIGWLDSEHPFPTGPVPPAFWTRLKQFCQAPVFVSRAMVLCPLDSQACKTGRGITVPWDDGEVEIRAAQIRVIGSDEQMYIAPHMLCHFIHAHHYRPPDVFIQAVLNGPLPHEPAYLAVKQQLGWR